MSPVDTGLDPDRSLDELDVDELEQVCRALYGTDLGLDDDKARRWGCYVTAFALRETLPLLFGDCERTARNCLAGEDPDPDDEDDEDCELDPDDLDDLPACAASITVGDIEACMDQLRRRAHDLAGSIDCDLDPDAVLGLPPACADIDARCPEILEG